VPSHILPSLFPSHTPECVSKPQSSVTCTGTCPHPHIHITPSTYHPRTLIVFTTISLSHSHLSPTLDLVLPPIPALVPSHAPYHSHCTHPFPSLSCVISPTFTHSTPLHMHMLFTPSHTSSGSHPPTPSCPCCAITPSHPPPLHTHTPVPLTLFQAHPRIIMPTHWSSLCCRTVSPPCPSI
jgi:hypothetical protein